MSGKCLSDKSGRLCSVWAHRRLCWLANCDGYDASEHMWSLLFVGLQSRYTDSQEICHRLALCMVVHVIQGGSVQALFMLSKVCKHCSCSAARLGSRDMKLNIVRSSWQFATRIKLCKKSHNGTVQGAWCLCAAQHQHHLSHKQHQ